MKRLGPAIVVLLTAAASSYVAYKLVTDDDFRNRVRREVVDTLSTSTKKVVGMSEEVAVRTAQMTRNPKINQEWVARQWEQVGY